MSRFFNKDMNIQNYAQAKAVSRHRLSPSQRDEPVYVNWDMFLLGEKNIKKCSKEIKNDILIACLCIFCL